MTKKDLVFNNQKIISATYICIILHPLRAHVLYLPSLVLFKRSVTSAITYYRVHRFIEVSNYVSTTWWCHVRNRFPQCWSFANRIHIDGFPQKWPVRRTFDLSVMIAGNNCWTNSRVVRDLIRRECCSCDITVSFVGPGGVRSLKLTSISSCSPWESWKPLICMKSTPY